MADGASIALAEDVAVAVAKEEGRRWHCCNDGGLRWWWEAE